MGGEEIPGDASVAALDLGDEYIDIGDLPRRGAIGERWGIGGVFEIGFGERVSADAADETGGLDLDALEAAGEGLAVGGVFESDVGVDHLGFDEFGE